MIFNTHSNLEGQHAFLGASKYHWIYYDEEKLVKTYTGFLATQRGTLLHDFASRCIKLGQKLPRSKKTLNMYVNDAIGFKMTPETVLYYSKYCFGTADAISFRDNVLRIHDLKSGVTPAHMEQLKIYAALFCLENNISPNDIQIELRIYQNNDISVLEPDPIEIGEIMDKAVAFSEIIESIDIQEGLDYGPIE